MNRLLERAFPNLVLALSLPSHLLPEDSANFAVYKFRYGSTTYRLAQELTSLPLADLYGALKRLHAAFPKQRILLLSPYLSLSDKRALRTLQQAYIAGDGEIAIPQGYHQPEEWPAYPLRWTLATQALYLFYYAKKPQAYPLSALSQSLGLSKVNALLQCRVLYGLGLLEETGITTSSRFSRIPSLARYIEQGYSYLMNPIVATIFIKQGSFDRAVKGKEESLEHYTALAGQGRGYCLNEQAQGSWAKEDLGFRQDEDDLEISLFAHGPYFEVEGYLHPLEVLAIYKNDPDIRVQAAIQKLKEDLKIPKDR